jgi:uncharacterized protein GlcG (DUF336 family)
MILLPPSSPTRVIPREGNDVADTVPTANIGTDAARRMIIAAVTTDEWHDFVEGDEQLRPGARTGIDRPVTFGGGYPVKVGGDIVGGIGVSGGHWRQDFDVAEAGLAAVDG